MLNHAALYEANKPRLPGQEQLLCPHLARC